MRNLLLGLACIIVLIVILSLGLWPFHTPRNDATWLKGRNGLLFGDYSTVISTGALDEPLSRDLQFCSVEVWLEPALTDNSGTILSFYAPENPLQLSVHQSLSDLMLQFRRPRTPDRASKQRIYFSDVFRQGRPVFVTVTSGLRGTSVYINGTLLKTARRLQFPPDACSGRLIVGDSPWQQDVWSGQLMGLGIYWSELAARTVLRHYDTWTKLGRPDIAAQDRAAALYLFDERNGNIAHNQARSAADLFMPGTYTVLDKIFLEPFWDEFDMSWSYWKNILKNIVGFVPLGFCFCAYFALVHKAKRAALATVVLGFAVSLTIEVLQGYLPTRDSGTTDLITNTLGTWIGVIVYNAARAQWDVRRRVSLEDRGPD